MRPAPGALSSRRHSRTSTTRRCEAQSLPKGCRIPAGGAAGCRGRTWRRAPSMCTCKGIRVTQRSASCAQEWCSIRKARVCVWQQKDGRLRSRKARIARVEGRRGDPRAPCDVGSTLATAMAAASPYALPCPTRRREGCRRDAFELLRKVQVDRKIR